MMFRGRFEYSIDPKGRVNIPAPFRDLALNLQVLDAAAPACTAAAAVVGPSGINDAQVEAYWKQVMP